MPISGRFDADFSTFTSAVEGAVLTLNKFEGNSANVEKQLGRMANALTGARVVADATLMAEAVDRVGGVSRLTEKELAKVSATGAEAAAKLRAMGEEVPPGIQRIANEAKGADTAHQSWKDTIADLALGFAAMFTARAAFNFVKQTVDEASALNDLSHQTHIGVEELQLLAGSMSEFGVDADELGKGLFRLSRGISGGDESVARGLHTMGLSLQEVEGLNGKELFLKIEAGLSTLQGGLRDTTAADLFGSKLGAAMAGASDGIQETMAKWQSLNHVASTESVEAMDAFGESIARAGKNLSSMAANMIGPLAQGFNVVNDAVDRGASKWSIALAVARDYFDTQATGVQQTGNLTRLLDQQNIAAEALAASHNKTAAAHRDVSVAVDQRTQAEKFMAALEADAAAKLEPAQLANLAHLKEIGALNEKNAAAIGVNAAQFEKYKAGLEAAKVAAQELSKAQAEADAIAMTGYQNRIKGLEAMAQASLKAYGFDAQIANLNQLDAAERALARSVFESLTSEKDRAKVIEDLTTRHIALVNEEAAVQLKQAGLVNAAVVAEFQAQVKLNEEYGRTVDGELKAAGAAETYRIALERLHATRVEGISQAQQEQVLVDAYTKALYDEAIAQDKMVQSLNAMPAAASNAASGVQQFTNTLVLGISDLETLNRELGKFYDTYAGQNSVGTPGGGNVGTPVGNSAGMARMPSAPQAVWFTTPANAGRASGGPVMAGQTYPVGEQGPELFTPSTNGFITPNGAAGGSVVANIYVNGTAEDVARQVANKILQMVSAGQKLRLNG